MIQGLCTEKPSNLQVVERLIFIQLLPRIVLNEDCFYNLVSLLHGRQKDILTSQFVCEARRKEYYFIIADTVAFSR